jgi:hypothetical protein
MVQSLSASLATLAILAEGDLAGIAKRVPTCYLPINRYAPDRRSGISDSRKVRPTRSLYHGPQSAERAPEVGVIHQPGWLVILLPRF